MIRCHDLNYVRFFRRLHSAVLVDWYMEVGCRTGRILRNSRSKTIAVDPFSQIDSNAIGAKAAFHAVQTTSDDFWSSGFLAKNDIKVSLAFLDGMHLMEFLLRDIIAAEAAADPSGALILHDCCPYTIAMTTRDLDNLPLGSWTGDVWKLIPILQRFRPDLKITALGCMPTGLVILTGLDPGNTELTRNYDQILADYQTLTLAEFGADRFYGSFEFTPVQDILDSNFAFLDGVRQDSALALDPKWVTP